MPADGIGIRRCPAGIDLHISANGPAKRLQPLQEGSEPCLVMRIVRCCGEEHADAPHPLALLRARRQRPRSRGTAEQRDERAASHHSITSSARAMIVGGISRPSAFAVFRLMTNSYLVGVCTGRFADLSPLRLRST